ncbi:MAG: hypothetical protein H0U10_01935, partial [Chloroflexia bacterium]|nr:hypothetical protein [Chloroflexia bacterium]
MARAPADELALDGVGGHDGGRFGWARLARIRELGILGAALGLFIALSIARPET